MTKSPRSVTKKLQLASLFRWLAILCFIKLAIFTMILLDLPFPAFLDKTADHIEPSPTQTQAKDDSEIRQTVNKAAPKETAKSEAPLPPLPQGAEAARLAQSLKPKHQNVRTTPPALQTEANADIRSIDIETEQALLGHTNLKLPKPLPAPIARAGEEPPKAKLLAENNTLPVPTLGSATAAQAAASMPVPQTGPADSPFAPVEQQSPLKLPGAPEIPSDIPTGRNGGQPLPLPSTNRMPIPDMQQPKPRSSIEMTTEAQEIARQQQDMLILKKQMDERLKELQESEAKMQRMLEEAQGVEAKKLKNLILMFANMKPKTAAKALEKMEPRTACQILRGMTAKQSGDILSYTNPAVTAKLTELLTRMKTY